ELLKGSLAWRLVNLTEAAGKHIDLVIATRFPSYLVKHPNKVVWLIHQLRQAYDLLGTDYSDFSAREPRDAKALEMIRAMDRRTLGETPVRCCIGGTGPEKDALAELIQRLGLQDRVELAGWIEDRGVAEHYANCLGVYYAPYDEDYGYVTVEAFKAAKPVITTADAGGVLEFVEDGVNGF